MHSLSLVSLTSALSLAGLSFAAPQGPPSYVHPPGLNGGPPPGLAGKTSDCRCFPGDDCWPGDGQWDSLNSTVNGQLIGTVPLASPCHYDQWDSYDNETCAALREGWTLPETHLTDSASIMAPFFTNRSCSPFTEPDAQCVIGRYAQYAINVTSAEDIQAGMSFAKENNIRLVIQTTGHDYNGKSTGAGSLSLWMWNNKDISFDDYSDSHYQGKAIKMGAGVVGGEAYEAADAQGLQVVGGECPTVALPGGYTQGGGHSALMSKHGLAADQVLAWELVTGEGEHLVAAREENTDLFWALSGGGGGTFGVVLSLTAKAHMDSPTTGMNLTFLASDAASQDDYYEAINTFHASLPEMVDAKIMSVWYFTNESFAISPITAPDLTVEEVKAFLAPLENKLKELDIKYTSYYNQFRGYKAFYDAMFAPIEVGIAQYGGRLIPRSVVQDNNQALTDAYRFINEQGAQFIGVAANVNASVAGDVDNSVNPGWRTALIDTVVTTPWDFEAPLEDMVADQLLITDVLIPKLAELTPDGSCYLNEGDFRQPDFQDVFYGSNYGRLLDIKNRYDPEHIFYATTAVGSEYWDVEPETGRLCKASA